MKYKNPIIPGFYPDPSVCRVGKDYYLVTSSFEYFPGVPIFHSKDLVNWEQIGYCLTRDSQLHLEKIKSSDGIFAPSIRHYNGTFYVATTNWTKNGNFYVSTNDINGEWSDPIWVKQDGIDPSLFFDDDGKVYFTSTGDRGIQQSLIDIKTGKLLSKPKMIWEGTGGRFPEGPHLYKINDKYYLMISEGGTEYGHMETIARSDSPWGPYEECPYNPILSHRDKGYHSIQGTGHADLVHAHNDSWWLVFLAFRPNGYPPCYHLGRETFLAPVAWSDDGWPLINKNKGVDLEMEANLLGAQKVSFNDFRDDFDNDKLGFEWNFIRNPKNYWSLSERKGYLRLMGTELNLDDVDSPAFIGKRQRHFDFSAKCLLEFEPNGDNEEAGITVRMNEKHHYEIYLSSINGQRHIFVRRRIGDLSAVLKMQKISTNRVFLEIGGDKDNYTFSFSLDNKKYTKLASGETRYLSTEVAGGFTGVFIGLYASGNGKKCTGPADFDWFLVK